jgi:O-antigen/teichoic acid export membrane protein
MKFRLKINLLASWGDHAVCVLIGLLLMPFVLNTIGDGQYGMWLFICSIAGYSGLMNLGFGETVSRFVAHHHAKGEIDKINGVVNAIGAVYLGMSVLVLLGAGVIAWLAPGLYDWGATSDAELRWVIMVLAANVVVGLLGSVFGGVIVGLQRIDLERTFRSTSGVFRLGITLLMLQKEYALVTLAVIFLATTMVENIGYLCVVFRQLPGLKIGWRYFKLQTLKECFGFSVFALLDGFAGKIIDATDTIVIGIAFGTKYIVPYYIAHRLTTFIVEPLHMIGMIAMPRGAQLSALEHDLRLRVLVRKGLGLSFLLVGAFFIGACFFGDHVMQAWVGRHFVESHALLLVLLGAQVIASPIRVLRGVLFGMGHVRYPAIAYMIEAVANLLLTLLLIPHFGLLGVAIGTAIPIVLVESFFLLPYALKKLGITRAEFLQQIIAPQLIPLIVLWLYCVAVTMSFSISTSWLHVVLVAGCGGAVLALSWLATHYCTRRLVSVEG